MPLAIAVEKIKAIIHFVSIRQSVADSPPEICYAFVLYEFIFSL